MTFGKQSNACRTAWIAVESKVKS